MAAEDFRPVLGVLLDGQLEGSGGPRSLLEGRGHWCSTASEALHARRPHSGASSCLSPGGLTCSLPCPPASRKSLTYFSRDPSATLQEATFDLPEVRRIFFGSFHKVLEGPGRTHACASLPKTLLAPKFWGRPPTGLCRTQAAHPRHRGSPSAPVVPSTLDVLTL